MEPWTALPNVIYTGSLREIGYFRECSLLALVCVCACSKDLQGASDIHEELRLLESSASMIGDCKT